MDRVDDADRAARYDWGMILAAVDDLLFSSKIRATAKQLEVTLQFARTPDEILTVARTQNPALAIFDLNSAKMDAIATIAALKHDPEAGSTRVMGFASHVHTELIRAARAAGADEVLPRSAFAGRLAEILQTAESSQS